ncbi:MAG: cation-translocating P-type ATPase [Myxococcota bacterium]
MPAHRVSERLATDVERGLAPDEARARRDRYGENRLPEAPKPNPLLRFLSQFADPLVATLLVAAVIAAVLAVTEGAGQGWLQRFGDTTAILLIVLLNAALGFIQERRAEAALEALEKMTAHTARVRRGGATAEVAARELVPGDVIDLEAGDAVPADVRLVQTADFATSEAALTGESTPVSKDAAPQLDENATLADRANMAYMGTAVARGRGRAVVVGTGAETEIGRIGAMIREAGRVRTPLEVRLARFGRIILFICLALSVALFIIGMVRGIQSWPVLLLTAVSLAVAAIPEGLPAITTITLALGMQRMAERGAIVRKLPAVETLGSATVICSDKTGTLTQNAMSVRTIDAPNLSLQVTGTGYEPKGTFAIGGETVTPENLPETVRRLVVAAVLCNSSRLVQKDGEWTVLGDPTEGALLVLGRKAGIDPDAVRREVQQERELPFDSDRRRMSVVVAWPDGTRTSHAKGAPDVILPRCSHIRTAEGDAPLSDAERERLLKVDEQRASQAHRVLALAERRDPGDDPESGLVFLGLVSMIDPPREGVREAVAECRAAGIKVVMVTGDHRSTAVAIARDLEFWEEDSIALTGDELETLEEAGLARTIERVAVFARVTAKQKLHIVRAFLQRDHVVAVTGDGVNDAPALREAPIGVAMGRGGTDVAREAAAMVLADDNFATIVHAVREGRAIFRNIRKFIFFLNSSNAGLVTAVIVSSFFTWMPHLTPLQLLWVNLVTNGLPALALGVDPPEPGQMREKPISVSAGIVGGRDLAGILLVGAIMGLGAFGMYFLPDLMPGIFRSGTRDGMLDEARSMAFTLLAISPLFHAHNCRSERRSIFQVGPWSNKYLWMAVAMSATVHLVTLFVEPLHPVFRTHWLTGDQWAVVLGMALLPVPIVEGLKAAERVLRPRR